MTQDDGSLRVYLDAEGGDSEAVLAVDQIPGLTAELIKQVFDSMDEEEASEEGEGGLEVEDS